MDTVERDRLAVIVFLLAVFLFSLISAVVAKYIYKKYCLPRRIRNGEGYPNLFSISSSFYQAMGFQRNDNAQPSAPPGNIIENESYRNIESLPDLEAETETETLPPTYAEITRST